MSILGFILAFFAGTGLLGALFLEIVKIRRALEYMAYTKDFVAHVKEGRQQASEQPAAESRSEDEVDMDSITQRIKGDMGHAKRRIMVEDEDEARPEPEPEPEPEPVKKYEKTKISVVEED